MMSLRCLYWFLILLIFPFSQGQALTFNLFSANNGAGLEAQRKLMKRALESLGHTAYDIDFNELPTAEDADQNVDINIFMEVICDEWFPFAKLNWLIPNPECYLQELSLLERIDLILCFTHEVERVFQELGKATYYSGFTSFDCFRPQIEKNFSHILHIAGKSLYKGTNAIIDAWKENSALPQLTLIRHYEEKPANLDHLRWIPIRIPEEALRQKQNHCGIHLCPSETEGFGHYIMEAMSTGAVVVTTDAPPMNEFVTDKRCLVPYQKSGPCALGTCYLISPEDLTKTVELLQGLPESELRKIGNRNRSIYRQKTMQFRINLMKLLDQIEQELS